MTRRRGWRVSMGLIRLCPAAWQRGSSTTTSSRSSSSSSNEYGCEAVTSRLAEVPCWHRCWADSGLRRQQETRWRCYGRHIGAGPGSGSCGRHADRPNPSETRACVLVWAVALGLGPAPALFLFAAVCCRPRTSAPDLMARPAGPQVDGRGRQFPRQMDGEGQAGIE